MSKFSKSLVLHQTGNAIPDRHTKIAESWGTSQHGLLKEYRLEATIGTKLLVEDYKEVSHMVNLARRQLVEAVFGEFRQPLYELSGLMCEYDIEAAQAKLDEIVKQMFE